MKLRKPNLRRVSIAIASLIILVLLLVINIDFERQTVQQFEAERIAFNDLEINGARLSLYQGLKTRSEFENNTMSTIRSTTGGIILKGQLRNTSNNDLFLPLFNMAGKVSERDTTGRRDFVVGLFVDDLPWEYEAMLWIHNTRLERNTSEFAGYRLDPQQEVTFELAAPGIDPAGSSNFALRIKWNVMDAEILNLRQGIATLNFTPAGSSTTWFDKRVEWKYRPAVYRNK